MLLSAVNGSLASVARYNHLRQTISGFVATFFVIRSALLIAAASRVVIRSKVNCPLVRHCPGNTGVRLTSQSRPIL